MAAAPDALLALAFADQCRRWARQLGASPAAIEAAGLAAHALAAAEAEGHVCLELAPEPGFSLEALQASGVAGPPGAGTPLILDGPRLYLARHYDAEARLARALLARHRYLPPPPGRAARQLLLRLFPGGQPGAPDGQQLAVALALCRRLTLISGGPGTGKTTTVARLLACLLADAPNLRIALAAPTGKAAARLQESLQARAADLPAAIAARLPQSASTLHRLLGLGVDGQAPRHRRDNPLPVDVLVVDEASMLDLGLALYVAEALPPEARLILLGDKDQLQAVEAGSVFAVLSASPALTPAGAAQLAELTGCPASALPVAAAPGPLADAVAWLQHSHRFAAASPLGRLAGALVRGEAALALQCLADGGAALTHIEAPETGLSPAEFDLLAAGYAPYRAALAAWRGDASGLAPLFAAFASYRVLCATRRGERGVEAINERLAACWRPLGSRSRPDLPFAGQPLMILENDPVTRLYNGDIGLALEDAEGLAVFFPEPGGGYRRLAPSRLPRWETAFALTVHKSQGSEFDAVALVLPTRDGPLLTRELVYTGVTRARQRVRLFASTDCFRLALARQVRREGGLAARLHECALPCESMSDSRGAFPSRAGGGF